MICLKDMRQLFNPPFFRIIQHLLESVNYDLVSSLGLSISLGICWGGIPIHYSQVTIVSPERFAIKLKAIFRDEDTRDSESSDNIFPKKFLGIYVPDIRQGFGFDPFSEVVHAD